MFDNARTVFTFLFRFVFICFVCLLFCVCVLCNYDLSPLSDRRHRNKKKKKHQPSTRQRVSNSNSSATDVKPPCPLPKSAVSNVSPASLPSLIHRSPNGGYVSLLRRTVATSGDTGSEAVRFNSLQRPNRRAPNASQRSVHQFRSMRNVGNNNNNGTKKSIGLASAIVKDKNNNRGDVLLERPDNNDGPNTGPAVERNSNINNETDPQRKDVVRKTSSTTAATLPKPAPRTRIPSATVAPPALAHRDTYANLQQLLNSDSDIVNKKVRNGPDGRLCP